MEREEAKKLLPVIQAYAEGKDVQYSNKKVENWYDAINPTFNTDVKWRIKPEPTYRPFKDADECWAEMQKHQPFGWVKDHIGYTQITAVSDSDDRRVKILCHIDDQDIDEQMIAGSYTFADGTPFGIIDNKED